MEHSKAKDAISTLRRVRRRDIKLKRIEHGLSRARAAIREAICNPSAKSLTEDKDYVPRGPVYRKMLGIQESGDVLRSFYVQLIIINLFLVLLVKFD